VTVISDPKITKCAKFDVSMHHRFYQDVVTLRLRTEGGEMLFYDIPRTEWDKNATLPFGEYGPFICSRLGRAAFWLYRKVHR